MGAEVQEGLPETQSEKTEAIDPKGPGGDLMPVLSYQPDPPPNVTLQEGRHLRATATFLTSPGTLGRVKPDLP